MLLWLLNTEVQTDGIGSYNKSANITSNTQVEKFLKFLPRADACWRADT